MRVGGDSDVRVGSCGDVGIGGGGDESTYFK